MQELLQQEEGVMVAGERGTGWSRSCMKLSEVLFHREKQKEPFMEGSEKSVGESRNSICLDPDPGKDCGPKEKGVTEDEMAG